MKDACPPDKDEVIRRFMRAYCEKAEEGSAHRRVVTVVDGMERETCRWCGDVKEHPPVKYADPYFDQPLPAPAVPDGFQLIDAN